MLIQEIRLRAVVDLLCRSLSAFTRTVRVNEGMEGTNDSLDGGEMLSRECVADGLRDKRGADETRANGVNCNIFSFEEWPH